MTPMTPEQRALCLGATTVLAAPARDALAGLVRDGLDWDRMWELGHLHEVLPLLAETLPAAAGDAVPPEWRGRATRRRHVTLQVNARLAEALLAVLGGLREAGVAAMPVKGLVVAEQLYGSLSARPCADLDVLVHPADLPAAREVLRSLGFAQSAAPPYKALVHQFHDPGWTRGVGNERVYLELHWALWADSQQRLGTDALWDRSVPATFLGRPVRILSPEDMLLHLAIHRTRSALRLRWVVDVAELIRRYGPELDWEAYLERARLAKARTSSWVVLTLAHDLLGAPVPADVLDRLAVGRVKRTLLARTCGEDALFRVSPAGVVKQQPHLSLRAFEEDGPRRIGRVLLGCVTRPVREALHNAGVVRVSRRMA
jgi:hypothetical protein